MGHVLLVPTLDYTFLSTDLQDLYNMSTRANTNYYVKYAMYVLFSSQKKPQPSYPA